MLKHTSSTIYYPQGNGQVESTNKVFDTLLTKLVNENQNDQMSTYPQILFIYNKITFKVKTDHAPFQFVYGLPLLPIEYLLPSKLGYYHDPTSIIILTINYQNQRNSKRTNQQHKTWQLLTCGIGCYGPKISTLKQNTSLKILCYGFQGLSKHIILSFRNDGLDHTGSNIVY